MTLLRSLSLRWLMAASFLAVFLLALATAGGFMYSWMERILGDSLLTRMDTHLHYVLGDLDPITDLKTAPQAMVEMLGRPAEVPDGFEMKAQHVAFELSRDSFLVAILDPDGRVLVRCPEGRVTTEPPPARALALLRWRCEHSASPPVTGPILPPISQDPAELPPPGVMRLLYKESWDRVVMVAPLARNGKLVGFAQMTGSWRYVDLLLQRISRRLVVGGVLLALAVCGIGILLSSALTLPLQRVADTAHRVEEGDFSARTGLSEGSNEIHMLGSAFDRMADRVEESFLQKRRFVADASHELKSPLTALVGAAHTLRLLEGEAPNPRREKVLDTMDRELTRMEVLVKDLLALSRAAETPAAEHSDPVNTRSVVEEAVLAALASAPQRRIERGPLPELWLMGDQAGLTRAVRNLLDNALRYTPEDRKVEVQVVQSGKEVRFEVQDQGCGIPAQHLKNLGKRFYRIEAGRARTSGGTGLGLSIVRAVARQHGGRLDISSTEGQGTRASLVLPLARGVEEP